MNIIVLFFVNDLAPSYQEEIFSSPKLPDKIRGPFSRIFNLMFLWPCIMNWPYKITNVMHWILFIP